jgi:hypothetical protein
MARRARRADGEQERRHGAGEGSYGPLVFEQQKVDEKDRGKNQRGRFAQQTERYRDEIEALIAAVGPSYVDQQAGDYGESGVNVAALDDVVHGFGDGGVDSVERGREEGDVAVGWVGPGEIENMPEQCVHQAELDEEPEEIGDLKVSGFEASRDGVVDGQRGGDQRTPASIRGQRAEGIGVFEDERDVVQVANVRVCGDGVEVVEVEIVMEVIGCR